MGSWSKVIFNAKSHGQCHVSLPWPYGKRLSSQQLLDLPNQSVCLVLVEMMLYESIFKLDLGSKIIFKI